MASKSEKNDGHRLGHAPHIHTNGENMLPSEEIEGKEEGEDLEEGEIEDDEEEVKPPEPSSVAPAAAENGTSKPSHAGEESEKKSRHHSERGRRGDDDDRHKRRRKKRKRGHGPEEDAEPKRRRRGAGPGQEEELEEGGIDDEDDDEDPDMMYVRGNSPLSKAADGPYDEGYGPGPGPGPNPYGANESPYNSDDSDFRRSASPPRRGDRGPRSKNRRTRGSAREERSRRNRDREAKDRSDRRDRNDRSDRRRNEKGGKSDTICGFYLEGKCSRDNDCPFSHAAVPPRKLELCKFYLMECCAKKEKCLYMHKDFPCKFFHTGRKCRSASAAQCKFSHDPLSDTTRAILIKHLESAPKEILGDFPRLTREEAVEAIDNTVNGVLIPRDKRPHIPSIFEMQMNKSTAAPAAAALADPLGLGGKDVDMRDVDYRFPNPEAQQQWAAAAQQFQQQQQSATGTADGSKGEQETGTGGSRPRFYQEQGVTAQGGGDSPKVPNLAQNVPSIASPEAEKETKAPAAGIWFRQLQDTNGSDYHSDGGLVMDIPGDEVSAEGKKEKKNEEAKKVEEVKKEKSEETENGTPIYAAVLPPKQPDLYDRLQAAAPKIKQDERSMEEDTAHDENWYSSDEEPQGKSLTDILKKINSADKTVKLANVPSTGLGQNVNLSSLSNLNLSNISPDDLAQMLSVIKSKAVAKTGKISPEPSSSTSAGQAYRDPRLSRDPRMRAGDVDLRVRTTSAAAAAFRGVDQQPQDIDLRLCPAPIPPSALTPGNSNDVDLRAALSRPLGNLDDIGSDVDLRRLSGDLLHSFKPPSLLPPAKEIEASIHAHAPIDYHVIEMHTSWPNYANIRFNPADPQALNDPRLNRSKHGHSPNDRALPAIQELPSGPASPDPPSRTASGGGYGYGPEIGSPDQSSVHNRRDPRIRDVRRMPTDRASLLPTPAVINPVYAPPPSARDPRGKPGLLGPAPPGMPVVGGEGPQHHWTESNAPSYAPRQEEYSAGGAMGGGINRRDPRQIRRVSNETNNSGEERSKTPPLKSVFREKDPTASPFS